MEKSLFFNNKSPLDKENINKILHEINDELVILNEYEELYIHGGAVMCIKGARMSTMDIDALYKNEETINRINSKLSKIYNIDEDFINNDIKPFLSSNGKYEEYLTLSNLNVYLATDEYMLALKCLACRTDSNDVRDLIYLVDKLGIESVEQVDEIVSSFYGNNVDVLYRDIVEDILNGTAEYYL